MRVVFGECEFDSGRHLLLRHGREMPLSLKAFQLLELLLDRRPEALAKKEILERLWPDTFVSDASLHNVVTELRAALGDSPGAARYIRTLPRYGYAFQADTRPAPGEMSGAPAGPWLVSKDREWHLPEGTHFVGRDRECRIRIDSATVSRRHARILVTGGATRVEDLGSKNGTRVNGRPVERQVPLADGDEIKVGSVTMIFKGATTLPSTLTREGRKS